MAAMKNPRPLAGGSGASEMFLPERPEDIAIEPFKSIADNKAQIVTRIARRYGLARPTAKTICELARLGADAR